MQRLFTPPVQRRRVNWWRWERSLPCRRFHWDLNYHVCPKILVPISNGDFPPYAGIQSFSFLGDLIPQKDLKSF